MPPFNPLTLSLLGALSLALSAHAHDHHHHEANPAAHQHGIGELSIAIDGQQLHLELTTPADDLLGFEHAPQSTADHAKVAALMSTLRQPQQLFSLPEKAGCQLDASSLHSPLFPAAEQPEPAETVAEQGHADVQAHYRYTCTHPEQLRYLEIKLFTRFPGAAKLGVQAVTPSGQTGGEVTATANRIDL